MAPAAAQNAEPREPKNPGAEGQEQKRRIEGCRRFVFNKALANQKERLAREEALLSLSELAGLLSAWIKDPQTAWLADAPADKLERDLADLDKAFRDYQAGAAEFPSFRKKGRWCDNDA